MSKRILVYLLHNPWPPKSGDHVRYLQMLNGLLQAGYEVSVAGSAFFSETPWTEEGRSGLKGQGIREVHVHEPSKFERLENKIERFIQRKRGWRPNLLERDLFYPFSLRHWFKRLVEKTRPDVLFLNHAWASQLVNHSRWPKVLKIIDEVFFVSLYHELAPKVSGLIEEFRKNGSCDELFNVNMFIQQDFKPDPYELKYFENFSYVITITKYSQEILEQYLKKPKVLWIPMALPCTIEKKEYAGNALFVAGPNQFNLQGLLFLVRRILPLIREKAPDFCVEVTGRFQEEMEGADGLKYLGFVPNVFDLYRSASICVCPVFVTVGQQIKIVEAMANGLPVVAMHGGALSSPLVHGENGFIAKTAEEFANYVLDLWRDRSLCEKIGIAARESSRRWAQENDSSPIFRRIIG